MYTYFDICLILLWYFSTIFFILLSFQYNLNLHLTTILEEHFCLFIRDNEPRESFPRPVGFHVPLTLGTMMQKTCVKHSNLKTLLCNKAKTVQLFLHYWGYSLSSNHMSSQRAFVL